MSTSPGLDTPRRGLVPRPLGLLDLAEPTRPARASPPAARLTWCTRPARACDADHVIPHNKAGPTTDDNLAPLCRRHHRLKTKTAWTYHTLDRGTWLWTDPHGLTYLRNHNGTRDLTGIQAA